MAKAHTLSEVLWGELLWDASRPMAAQAVILIGFILGQFPPLALLTLLVVSSEPFSLRGMGLVVAAIARMIFEHISLSAVSFGFSDVFLLRSFLSSRNPAAGMQWVAWVLPLTAVNSL